MNLLNKDEYVIERVEKIKRYIESNKELDELVNNFRYYDTSFSEESDSFSMIFYNKDKMSISVMFRFDENNEIIDPSIERLLTILK